MLDLIRRTSVHSSSLLYFDDFQADVLYKIIDGINNPTMGTGSTGLDGKKHFNTICGIPMVKGPIGHT